MIKTILLVDDDIDLLHALSELLRRSGYSVSEYSDSCEALECFRQNEDLTCILTDIDMPGLDGISLLAEIRRIRPDADAVLMTGNFDHLDHEFSQQILRKPFSYDELVRALKGCTTLN